MSTKIRLEFSRDIDLELSKTKFWLPIIRVLANVQFVQPDGSMSRLHKAIVDTGNPLTTIPKSIWQQAKTQILIEQSVHLAGIGQGEISGQIAQVYIAFADEKRTSRIFEIPAFLVSNDQTPLIIGFHKVLSEHKLMCDYRRGKAFLQIK